MKIQDSKLIKSQGGQILSLQSTVNNLNAEISLKFGKVDSIVAIHSPKDLAVFRFINHTAASKSIQDLTTIY